MSLFGKFRRQQGGHGPSGAAKGSESTGGAHQAVRLRSLALGALFSNLVPGGAYEFLDLGPAIGPNVQFLSRYVRSVQVGDLWATLRSTAPTSGPGRIERALEPLIDPLPDPLPDQGALDQGGPGRYHGILTWDLLNYLDREELQVAATALSRALRPGGFLLALIYYAADMPAEPLRYHILDTETLRHEAPQLRRPSPRYPQRTLNLAFSSLAIDRSYLLKTGLQEYLFVRPERSGQSASPAG